MGIGLKGMNINRQLVQRYLETHYIGQMIIFLFPRLTINNIERVHTFQNLDIIKEELRNNRGCILIHAHFGPAHLPLFHLAIAGYPIMQMSYLREPENLSAIGRMISFRLRERYEKKIPAKFTQVNQFLRPAFTHLKENGLLMITGDGTGMGEFRGRFVPFPFLGHSMPFPIGPALFANKTGASLIPMFTVRDARCRRFVTVIEEPLQTVTKFGEKDDPIVTTNKFVTLFESYIKKYPYHWHFWDEFEKGKLIR